MRKLSRRVKIIWGSRWFWALMVMGVAIGGLYLVFFTELIKKSPPPVEAEVEQAVMTLTLISYEPEVASGSSLLVEELKAIEQPPFQKVVLLSSGRLADGVSEGEVIPILVNGELLTEEEGQNLIGLRKLLAEQMIEYQRLWVSGDHFGLLLPDKLGVILRSEGDVRHSLDTLQEIRSGSTMKLTGVVVDLRFDNPVISLNQIP